VIWGAGGHALVIADLLRRRGGFEIVGFIDDLQPGRAGEAFNGATILGSGESLRIAREGGATHLVVAIGNSQVRLKLAAKAEELGFELAPAIHPGASIAQDAVIGAGTQVIAGGVSIRLRNSGVVSSSIPVPAWITSASSRMACMCRRGRGLAEVCASGGVH